MTPVPRQATGTIIEHRWKDGQTVTFGLRVPYQRRKHLITLGTNFEGWTRERAEIELEKIVGQMRRGSWSPASAEPAPPLAEADREQLRVTLSRWWQAKKPNLSENASADYEWRLKHIVNFRPDTPTADIDERWVDELRDHLARQPARNRRKGSTKTLSPSSVNKVLDALAQILDLAVDYKILATNPARGKRRRMVVKKSRRAWLEPDMVLDLLEAAGEWERELEERKRPDQCFGRRALLALLCLGGPRISEVTNADRGDFDLAGDHWRIPASKTEAGARTVELTVFAAGELRRHVADTAGRGRPVTARKPMFPTANGTRLGQGNVRRMLREVVKRTNERREAEGKMLLPDVTPHSLRVTFASLCFFAGRDPAWVMGQIGHSDARLTLEVYTRTLQRKKVDRALVWRLMHFADEPEERPGIGHKSGHMAEEGTSGADARIRRA